jgi:membrane-associated protease RseP (regulator of RpoE activity)
VAADIRTLIKLIGGKPPEAPAPQEQARASQPPAAAPQDWSALPELPKPAAQPQGGDAPSAPAIRTGSMTAAERAAFERKMQQDKNLRDLILLLRSRTPEKQEETLVWMQINWGENSWEFEKIRRYLGLTLSKPEMPATPFALDLLDSLGARLTSAQDGMRVTELRDGSPAAAAGLRVGDLITHLNGRPLTDLDKAREWLGQQGNGQPARLDVKRRNDELTLTVPNQ